MQLPQVVSSAPVEEQILPLVDSLVTTLEPLLFAQDDCALIEGSSRPHGETLPNVTATLDAPLLPLDDLGNATGSGLEITTDFMDVTLEEAITQLGVDARFQGLRRVVTVLIKLVKGYSAQMRVLLALLARRLPQPNLRVQDAALPPQQGHRLRGTSPGSTHAFTADCFRREHMDFNNTIPLLGHVGQMAMDVMAYLENGQFDDLSSTQGEDTSTRPADPGPGPHSAGRPSRR